MHFSIIKVLKIPYRYEFFSKHSFRNLYIFKFIHTRKLLLKTLIESKRQS